MQKLANFSVETDTLVLLYFQDGAEQRVATAQLTKYLAGADLDRVRAALKLRRTFLKDHLPKMGLVLLLTIGLVALVTSANKMVARFFPPPPSPQAAPIHEDVARMVAPATSTEPPSSSKPVTVQDQSPAPVVARRQLVIMPHRVAARPAQPPVPRTPAPTISLRLELPALSLPGPAGLLDSVPVLVTSPIATDTKPATPATKPSDSETGATSTLETTPQPVVIDATVVDSVTPQQ